MCCIFILRQLFGWSFGFNSFKQRFRRKLELKHNALQFTETMGKCLCAYQRLLSNIIRISYSMCVLVRLWVVWIRVKLHWVFRNVKLLSIFFLYFVIISHFASLVTFLSGNDWIGRCSRILLYICTIKILAVSGRRASKWDTNRPVYWTWRIRNKHQRCLFRVDQV